MLRGLSPLSASKVERTQRLTGLCLQTGEQRGAGLQPAGVRPGDRGGRLDGEPRRPAARPGGSSHSPLCMIQTSACSVTACTNLASLLQYLIIRYNASDIGNINILLKLI